MFIRQRLPDKHLTPETENVVKLGMGVIATIGALVISLLLGSAKTSFDVKDGELKMFAADLILLDRQLVHLGVDGTEARGLLRRYTRHQIAATWPDERTQPMDEKNGTLLLEDVQVRLRALTPATMPSARCNPVPCRSAATLRKPAGSCGNRRGARSPRRSC